MKVTAFTLSNFGFYVDVSGEKGKDNQCSFGAIDLSMLEDVTASLKNAGHTIDDDTRTFRFSVRTQDFDRFTDNCIRLDYDIVGTFHSGDASVTLANQDSSVEFTQDSSSNTLVSGSINNRYDRTGFRLIAPSVTTVSSTANNVITGETITLEFNVTDNDDDDGPDNGIRNDRYRVELASIYGVCDITKWTVGTITSKSGDNYIYTVDVTTKSAVVSGDTCRVGIDVTEDGDAAKGTSQPITVSFVDIAPPTIVRASGGVSNDVADAGNRVIPVSGTSVNQELGTFTITRQVTSAEITTYGLGLNVFAELGANCGGITISNGTQSGNNYPFTYTIGSGATEAAACVVTIAATETASIGSSAVFRSVPIDTVTITPREEIAPGVVLSIPANLDDLTNYNDGFTATATITDGDDDDGFADVRSSLTSTSTGVCTVDESTHQLTSPSETITRAVTIVGMPGDTCNLLLTSTANGKENTTNANVELPELVPSISSIDYTPSATTDTRVPITVSLTDIDNDGKFGVFRVVMETGGCDFGTHTGVDGAMESVIISSSSERTCTFKVRVDEDSEMVTSGLQTIRFTPPVPADAAPRITGKELNTTTANINEIVSLTVNISNTDMDPLAGAFISAGSAGSSGCTVVPAADIVISSDSETGTQVFNITSAIAGECIITVNATEGAFTSANEQVETITFMRPEVAPGFSSVLPYLSGRKIGNAAAFELDIRIDDGDRIDGFANASITASSNPRDCTIAQVGNIEFVSSSRATQTFRVKGVSAGFCQLTFTAAENGTESDDRIVTVEFIERVGPNVTGIALTGSNAVFISTEISKQTNEMFYINVTIENVDDADDLVSNTIDPNPTGCTVTSVTDLKVRGDNANTGADLTQSFIVTATSAGPCTISPIARNSGTGDPDSAPFTPPLELTFIEVPLSVENVVIKPVNAIVGQPAIVNVSVSDTDDLSAVTVKVTIVSTSSSANCRVETGTSATRPANEGFATFTISSADGPSTCELNITAIEDSMESDVYTPRPIITFTEPGDAGPIILAWSDQVDESPFNGYMSIGNAGTTSNVDIPNLGLANSFVPATIGSRLAMVHTRFRDQDKKAVNYGETIFALSDEALDDAHNLVKQFLVQVERGEYVTQGSNVVSRDMLLFYADTSSNHFDDTVLSTGAQTALENAGIRRYLRFTTMAPETKSAGGVGQDTVNNAGNVRSVTTIPFAATYDNQKRLVRTENNRENFILPGGDPSSPVSVNVSRYAGVTDLINIDVSNVPAAGAKISASICRLEGFDGAEQISTDCTSNSFANATEIKNILLLGGYWDREPFDSCSAATAGGASRSDFYGWSIGSSNTGRDLVYYCTGGASSNDAVVPKTLISGATHEKTLAAGSADTEFPMHIRQFMNTLPENTEAADDYSLNEKNGYYLITIQAQDSSGITIPGSNELKMLFHIGWEFP